jgi:hypothetical protein
VFDHAFFEVGKPPLALGRGSRKHVRRQQHWPENTLDAVPRRNLQPPQQKKA